MEKKLIIVLNFLIYWIILYIQVMLITKPYNKIFMSVLRNIKHHTMNFNLAFCYHFITFHVL